MQDSDSGPTQPSDKFTAGKRVAVEYTEKVPQDQQLYTLATSLNQSDGLKDLSRKWALTYIRVCSS